jgi:hypothetical protein
MTSLHRPALLLIVVAATSCPGGADSPGGPVDRRLDRVRHELRRHPSPDGKRAVETAIITAGEHRKGSRGLLGCGARPAGDSYRVEVALTVPGRVLRLKGRPIPEGVLLAGRDGYASREDAWGVTSSLELESCWDRDSRRAALRAAIHQPLAQRDFALVEFREGTAMRWGSVQAATCKEAVALAPLEWHESP